MKFQPDEEVLFHGERAVIVSQMTHHVYIVRSPSGQRRLAHVWDLRPAQTQVLVLPIADAV